MSARADWQAPWGPSEKHAYRRGIEKGRALEAEEARNSLVAAGYYDASTFLATGEIPLEKPGITIAEGQMVPPGTYELRYQRDIRAWIMRKKDD